MKLFFLSVVVVVTLVGLSEAGKILVFFPISFKSHVIPFEPVILELANRGHQVVAVSPWVIPNAPANMKQIVTYADVKQFVELYRDVDVISLRSSFLAQLNFTAGLSRRALYSACRAIYKRQDILSLLDEVPRFDLVITETLTNHMMGFVHQLKAPFVQYSSFVSPLSIVAATTGNRPPPSFVPLTIFPGTFTTCFLDRCLNFALTYASDMIFHMTMQLYWNYQEEYLGNDLPSWHEIMSNMSMFFTNSNLVCQHQQPVLPDMLQIGGLHCRPPNALPEDLDAFVSGASDGLILFSLGSLVGEHHMSNRIRNLLLDVFARLPQRVLWKWETERMSEQVPANVKLHRWIPQQDVLGHPNTILFISHGGISSFHESIYHGKPMIILPLQSDNDVNAGCASTAGIAVKLEILDLTEVKLLEAINLILHDSSYTENARKLSLVFRDQPQTPLERAVFWSEYIMRHKGAKHLRSSARELNFFQYYCLDVAAGLGILAIIILWIFKLLVARIISARKSFKPEPNCKQD